MLLVDPVCTRNWDREKANRREMQAIRAEPIRIWNAAGHHRPCPAMPSRSRSRTQPANSWAIGTATIIGAKTMSRETTVPIMNRTKVSKWVPNKTVPICHCRPLVLQLRMYNLRTFKHPSRWCQQLQEKPHCTWKTRLCVASVFNAQEPICSTKNVRVPTCSS